MTNERLRSRGEPDDHGDDSGGPGRNQEIRRRANDVVREALDKIKEVDVEHQLSLMKNQSGQ